MKMWTRHSTLALFALIGVLLPVLAYLQYHWLGELSRLEQQHRADNLRVAARRFSGDFDTELARLYQAFHVREAKLSEAATELSSDYAKWAASVTYADANDIRFSLADEGILELLRGVFIRGIE